MKKLYKFTLDCGRMGAVEGLFIAAPEDINDAIGKEVYFGEILGKHSDIYCTFDTKYLSVISEDQEKIKWLEGILGKSVSGYNPLDYLQENEEPDYNFEEDEGE